ncbi:aminotransferase class I/II-fold pyridoxal phosphate-dependent enzyme [Secundilactobacillus folii]|uniref:Aminotransferase class I/II-fold pyridoxal phosphate-dependent enzyme n=1 Tax=Secundilactobacillus folii TaxID=2678357 RepID=A0A7X2XX15_9LACO|nr:aminotransferase class I/II-fold pyridoxal phosphate-dependent enzyme [Secundilactobacillus folii]MTV83163.1 aminotransferase class I/II-fold pyridoxal phosphate-dependent enzyme [Secundilactobacillus folii]
MSEHIETILAQAGNRTDDVKTGAVSTPLYFSTAYRHAGLGQSTGYDYSRETNPTRDVLQQTLAKLENGVAAFALSSGMAAIQLTFSQFKTGDEIVVSDDLYGGSFRFFDLLTDNYGLKFHLWDGKDFNHLATLTARSTVKAVWLETPSNPTMKMIDIKQTAAIAHKHNVQVIADNTFYTPLLQQPLNEGADIVVHSATKYLSGHNDILAGAVVCKYDSDAKWLARNLTTTGATLDPFDCWLLVRSLKTLPLRLAKHEANAKAIVASLQQNDAVDKVLYPGHGGMISFYVHNEEWVNTILQHLQVISFAESLGSVESLMTVPAIQTHKDLTEKQRQAKGITRNLLRLSVGIENSDDLIDDLSQAINAAAETVKNK